MKIAEYLNKTVWATLGVSKIHGIGVIAIRDIPKDTKFTDYDIYGNADMHLPVIMQANEDEFDKILPEIRELILDKTIIRDKIIFASPNHVQDLRSWMNHSDDPNIVDFTTTREIKGGEELTEDFRWFQPWHRLTAEHYDFIKII